MNLASIVKADFVPFSDPATEVKVTQGTQGLLVQLVRNGAEHEYFFTADSGAITARHLKGKRFAGIRSLIASSEFADIKGLASTQLRLFRDFDPESLIPPEGQVDDDQLNIPLLSKRLSPRTFAPGDTQHLSVALIDGPAGVGKTSLINRYLVLRAKRQQESSAVPPILHVASRGRRLTGLDDALAQSIQIVRAKFTFDQTPVLIRHNLIQLAIDGFDELVDPEGYKDAWYALRDFFDTTRFGGPIILAGRDTFFDEQSFSRQMQDSKHHFQLTHIRLSTVTPSTARGWLQRQGWRQQDIDDPYTNVVLRPGSYALRPYFLSELAGAKSWNAIEDKDLSPRAFLVEKFVRRESDLIGDQLSVQKEGIRTKLANLFEEIALEMADNEADSVDLGFLQLATEVAFGDLLDAQALAKLKHKAGSFALLERDSREGYRRFPHTEISHHFLALALLRTVVEGTLTRYLRRGLVSADFLAIFGELFNVCNVDVAEKFVLRLERVIAEEASYDRLSENSAALLIASLSRADIPRSKYSDLQIMDAVLFGSASTNTLERVRMQRLDAREADLTQVQFIDCEATNLFVDATTRFGESAPHVHHLIEFSGEGKSQIIFDPESIRKWIQDHSDATEEPPANPEALRLFEKVCRTMLRQHMIKDHANDPVGRMLHERYWKEIEAILKDEGLVDRLEKKPTSGARATFLRMWNPYNLLVHRDDNPEIAAVWRKIGDIPTK